MSSRFFRRSRAALTGLALCGAATVAVLPATSGAASAAQVPSTGTGATTATAIATGNDYAFAAVSTGLYLDIKGASKAKGARVVQWTSPLTASEIWHAGLHGQLRNLNSGMCLTTDGTAGDQLYQWPCRPSLAAHQTWAIFPDGAGNGAWVIVNPASYLFVDVYQNNTTLGGPIDAWPDNGGYPNQQFAITSVVVDGPKG